MPTVSTIKSNHHYCSNLVYNNDRLSTILFDGGYASVDEGGGIVMHFYVKDHLGSNRLVVDGNGNIEEVNHYYPFGALLKRIGDYFLLSLPNQNFGSESCLTT